MLQMTQHHQHQHQHHHHQQHPHQSHLQSPSHHLQHFHKHMGEQTHDRSPPPPPPLQPSSSSIYQDDPTQNASSSKIPFRPRKVRKTSSDSAGTDSSSKTSAVTTTNNNNKQQLVRILPPCLSRPLSSDGEITIALRHLRSVDPDLSRVIDSHQPPTFQNHYSPFHSLARSILYQQLAMKAASSIYGRFISLCGGEANVVPEAVLALTPQQLRQIGVSARKAGYLHDLASKYCGGILSDAAIIAMDDKSLFSMLTMVKGIGAWSVHMFMIFSLHRPDVLPVGDLGVRKGVQMLYGLDELPRPSQMEQHCEKWKPYRSVGSWYMWRLLENKPTTQTMVTSVGAGQQQQLIDPLNGIANLG
eukprot:TRINITY_DN508_c0_g2_i1.p1 TRINITY_DN508_c0_g2~~TRINITY_DN508_c0_g2_i1.p1  ORF type:complete len:359 (+),score=61.79 TRINITY_DN508_c0_g2_i1:255-1331(+)